MSIEMKNPTPEEVIAMKEFAALIESTTTYITEYELNNAAVQSLNRLQEAMSWFHSFILNGAKKLQPLAGEILPGNGTVN